MTPTHIGFKEEIAWGHGDRSSEGESAERDAERDRRAFLAGVAFGRGQDLEIANGG